MRRSLQANFLTKSSSHAAAAPPLVLPVPVESTTASSTRTRDDINYLLYYRTMDQPPPPPPPPPPPVPAAAAAGKRKAPNPPCGRCSNCLFIEEGVSQYKTDNARTKARKRLSKNRKCTGEGRPVAQRRRTVTELMHTNGAGGRPDALSSVPEALPRDDRSGRPLPGDLNEDTFDSVAYDEYANLVLQCTRAADVTVSLEVKSESIAILAKMRSILDPRVRDEVDFAEATKDGSVILKRWLEGRVVGSRAFVPDLVDRDECFAAVRILSCASEERKVIVDEYIDSFGEEGVLIYNELLNNIGEKDKQCMPFVNMCLRAWKTRLSEDANLWADLTLLDFDKWLAEEMERRRAAGYKGKTSYELMMGMFGREKKSSSSPVAPNISNADATDGSMVREVFGCEISTTAEEPRKTQGSGAAERVSRLDDEYGGGTQNLVRHLAWKHPRPNTERSTRHYGMRGLYSATMYIYMYIPEDGICQETVAADVGYSGSSKDHYYRSKGATVDVSRLVRRQRVCGCEPCLKLQPGCTLLPSNSDLLAAATPQALTVNVPAARPAPAARHTRNARNPLPEFCEGLNVGDHVIVRISNDEREDNPNEEYFVAKIEEKAKKLEAGGVYSAVQYRKGDWIVLVRWYVFEKVDEEGDRLYKKGLVQYIPCNSIVRNISMPVTLDWTGRAYRLSSTLDAHIEKFGDISY